MKGSKCLLFIAFLVNNFVQFDCATGYTSQNVGNEISSLLEEHSSGHENGKGTKSCGTAQLPEYQCESLDDSKMGKLSLLSDMVEFKKLLQPMLIVRVPGTEGNRQVQNHIISHMERNKWKVEKDEFQSDTPLDVKTFTNIIATLNPGAPYRLLLACHFDSKKFDFEFIGATDSAVPCAMLLDIARTMNNSLHRWASSSQNAKKIGLQFVFFDGEEAFKSWTSTDSIYGAQHLAEKWAKPSITDNISQLSRITAFVLLDLIGTKKTQFRNWFPSTDSLYKSLHEIERKMRSPQLNLLDVDQENSGLFFAPGPVVGGIEDDHIPFLQKNVPVLHLISFPFPDEWHKESDKEEALDYTTIDNLNKILRVFVAEYLNLIP